MTKPKKRRSTRLIDRLPSRLRNPDLESLIQAKAVQYNGWHKYAAYAAFCDWQIDASAALGTSTARAYDLAAENGVGYWSWLAAGERLDQTK